MQHCLKQKVKATIVTPSGEEFIGYNMIDPSIKVCPRDEISAKSGERYDLCKSVCKQQGHAEEVALGLVGEKSEGSVLYLEGHTYACDNCKSLSKAAGIKTIVVVI